MDDRNRPEPIALIGMGCRFPGGVHTPEAFWHLLRHGVDAVTAMPSSRWNVEAYYDPDPGAPGKMYVRTGSFLDEIDQFDPQFFRMAPREAASLDPQQRLVLEVSWEALEHAGVAPTRLQGSQTGVFMGVFWDDYSAQRLYATDPGQIGRHPILSNLRGLAAGRVAHLLDLHGPVMPVDAACSSSLLAIHLACQALRQQECDLALAGGVYLMCSPEIIIGLCRMQALSPDSRSKAFDAKADGFGLGEGCGVVVLKRLADALQDGDPILALIRGSAVNHDGRSNSVTQPNGLAQQAVLRQALAHAGVEPGQVQYVEAHGTGTVLGDPIEVLAVAKVFGQARQAPLALGSVKTNFGHLNAAAGVAGLMKVVLALQHGEIPPHLHLTEPNPRIPWHDLPITVPTACTPWIGEPRRAGISAFGMSGTNVHVIVEEAPQRTVAPDTSHAFIASRPLHLLTLSAKTEEALVTLAARYDRHLASTEQTLGDIGYSANTGRSHFPHRLALVADSTAQLRAQVAAVAQGQQAHGGMAGHVPGRQRPQIAFLFTGQGSQYVNMGRQLYETQPTFRHALQQCDDILRPALEQPLLSILYPADPAGSTLATSLLDETVYTQPALFALEYALATLWASWHIQPDIVMGHSVGEYTAACVAGVFSLEEGLQLVAARGRLMQALPRVGAMVAVRAEEARVAAALQPYGRDVSIAAVNGPHDVVIAGHRQAVQVVVAALQEKGITTQALRVSHAFHSPLMEPMLADFEAVARQVHYAPAQIKLLSNSTGTLADSNVTTPAYWVRHVRQPVRFMDGVNTLHTQGYHVFVEVGPKPVLLSLGQHCLPPGYGVWLPSLRAHHEWSQMLESLGTLYVHGVEIDWAGFDQDYARRKVVLPTYPFQRQRYWVDVAPRSQPAPGRESRGAAPHPLLGHKVPLAGSDALRFESHLRRDRPAYLADHRVFEHAILPAAAYLEMALAAGSWTFRAQRPLLLEDVMLQRALWLSEAATHTLQSVLTVAPGQVAAFQVFSQDLVTDAEQEEPVWQCYASGRVRVGEEPAQGQVDLTALCASFREQRQAQEHYRQCQERGLEYGPSFRALQELWWRPGAALGRVHLPADLRADRDRYILHPVLLDACFQVILAALPEADAADIYLPFGIKQLRLYRGSEEGLWSHATMQPLQDGQREIVSVDLRLVAPDGQVVAAIDGLQLKRTNRLVLLEKGPWHNWRYEVVWQPQIGVSRSAPTPTPAVPLRSLAQAETAGAVRGRRWLVFADSQGMGQSLAALLADHGDAAAVVLPGSTYEQVNEDTFRIGPTAAADYDALLEAVAEVSGIVHLWGVEAPAPEALSGEALATAAWSGCGSLLSLVQALSVLAQPPQLWTVTQGAVACPEPQQAVPAAVPGLAQAPVWGFGNVMALEHPELQCVRIDLDPGATVQEAVHLLLHEVTQAASEPREDQVAWRGQRRHVARLARQAPSRAAVARPPTVTIRQDGSYLITGGLGGLGLVVARWLVEHGAHHIVLLGRNRPGETARLHIAALEALGVQPMIAQVDVTRQDQLSQVLAGLGRPLRGVIHAAGLFEDGIIRQQTWERFARVLAPKVWGAWNLHVLTKDMPLDFFVLFSSVVSLLGAAGQASYGAANAFLDALAHYRRAQALPALAINWGGWSEVGAAAQHVSRIRRRGMGTIAPGQGGEILGQLLAEPAAQVAVLPMDWSQFSPAAPFLRDLQATAAPPPQRGFREQLMATPAYEQRRLLTRHVREQVAQVLGSPDGASLRGSQGFFDMGMDSLTSLELRNHLQTSLACVLPATLTFNYATVEELVHYLFTEVLALPDPGEQAVPGPQERAVNPDAPGLEATLNALSDEELAARLAAKLAGL